MESKDIFFPWLVLSGHLSSICQKLQSNWVQRHHTLWVRDWLSSVFTVGRFVSRLQRGPAPETGTAALLLAAFQHLTKQEFPAGRDSLKPCVLGRKHFRIDIKDSSLLLCVVKTAPQDLGPGSRLVCVWITSNLRDSAATAGASGDPSCRAPAGCSCLVHPNLSSRDHQLLPQPGVVAGQHSVPLCN